MDPTVIDLRPAIDDATKASIATLFTALPSDKRAAVLVIADLNGNARGMVAANLGKHWRVAAGAGFNIGEKRPAGYVAVEGSW